MKLETLKTFEKERKQKNKKQVVVSLESFWIITDSLEVTYDVIQSYKITSICFTNLFTFMLFFKNQNHDTFLNVILLL